MEELLFIVTDRFRVPDGLLLTPGAGTLGEQFRVGMPLVVKRPDGTRLDRPAYVGTFIHAPNPITNPFIVLTSADEHEIPVGSEVWTAAE